jgi:HpcH/HpaI aldolase/citrate lyase family
LCQPIEIQIAYGNSDFDAQHDDVRDTAPPASRILFRPIATSRQWLASEMDAAPLAMEEDLEITVFLTRHSHLNPHVSQRFQPALDAGAEGIMFPLVRSATEAADCVALTRYPPRGGRGWGPFIARSRWGASNRGFRGKSDLKCSL